MAEIAKQLIGELENGHHLTTAQFETLLTTAEADNWQHATESANALRVKNFGNVIYLRGLVEFTNYCKNDCLYCGIRRSNRDVTRYRLSEEQILDCLETGYGAGLRTLVLQGGEDPHFTDERLCAIITSVKTRHPDIAVTLSLGERSRESYRRLRDAGADRYLLRHETADERHYTLLHPAEQTFVNRMACLHALKELGFQVGCGMMVGSPFQTAGCLARDLAFIQDFRPHMVGLGPFIPHQATPFATKPHGSVEDTLHLLSLVRLILPKVLLPATTALATLSPQGRLDGILAGANVVMPNLSPRDVRGHYTLYDNKANTGEEAVEGLARLREDLATIGCRTVVDRGDAPT